MAEIGRLLTAMVTPFTTTGEVDYVRAREISKKIMIVLEYCKSSEK